MTRELAFHFFLIAMTGFVTWIGFYPVAVMILMLWCFLFADSYARRVHGKAFLDG